MDVDTPSMAEQQAQELKSKVEEQPKQNYGTLQDVPQLLKRTPSAGERWYVLEKKWYDVCMAHILEGGEPPGQIDNSCKFVFLNF